MLEFVERRGDLVVDADFNFDAEVDVPADEF